MFQTRWMNHFSRVKWFIPILIVLPLMAWEIVTNYPYSDSWILPIAFFMVGMFIWSFTEYVFHRYLFHFNNHKAWSERMHFVLHGIHHDYPNDHLRLVMPPVMSLTIIGISFLVSLLFGAYWWCAHSGYIFGYLLYDLIHYSIHHASWQWSWFKKLKRHHAQHHYQDEHVNYGVSSSLWDHVFGTKMKK